MLDYGLRAALQRDRQAIQLSQCFANVRTKGIQARPFFKQSLFAVAFRDVARGASDSFYAAVARNDGREDVLVTADLSREIAKSCFMPHGLSRGKHLLYISGQSG